MKDWVIPPGIMRLKRTLVGKPNQREVSDKEMSLLLSTFSIKFNFNEIYQSAKSERCFILATGPSVKQQNLKNLKGEKCIAVSMFHLHEHIKDINPIWHVLAPPHFPFKDDTVEKIFSTLCTQYDASMPTRLLLGHTAYQHSYLKHLSKTETDLLRKFAGKLYFVNYGRAPVIDEVNYANERLWDLRQTPFHTRTVIYSAIQLAYFLGFKEIVLVGCDHDYLSDINRVENHHFYADEKGFSDKDNLSLFTRERWFFEYYNRWKGYRLMRKFLEEKGVSIYNATDGGMLDVFERKDLSLFLNIQK